MKRQIPIFLIVLSLAVIYFYVYPEYQKIQAQRLESLQYDDVLAKAVDLKNLRAQLSAKLSTFSQEDIDKLSKMIPAKVDYAHLILDIANVGLKRGISIKDIKTTEVPMASTGDTATTGTNRPYVTSSISFSFASSYENMIAFAKSLEESLRLVDVTDISITQPTAKGSNQLNYTMTLQTYWLNQKK